MLVVALLGLNERRMDKCAADSLLAVLGQSHQVPNSGGGRSPTGTPFRRAKKCTCSSFFMAESFNASHCFVALGLREIGRGGRDIQSDAGENSS